MPTILSDTLPEDGAIFDFPPIVSPEKFLQEGKNVFVTLITGEFYVGLCEFVDPWTITVGANSPEINLRTIESSREV